MSLPFSASRADRNPIAALTLISAALVDLLPLPDPSGPEMSESLPPPPLPPLFWDEPGPVADGVKLPMLVTLFGTEV